MPDITTTFTDSRVTFHGLFTRFSRVEIPIIQRDYAQGRPTAEDLRIGLLEAFRTALDRDNAGSNLPLDLDFIYGSITEHVETKELTFCPLDGQQRLTTLFLLHWFAAWVDGAGDRFKKQFCKENKAKFSYLVRSYSEEFFDKLAFYFPTYRAGDPRPVSSVLQDEPWFFLFWKQDPTVQSALVMLDAIQKVFADKPGLYVKLEHSEHPLITFQLLELEQFGLSDDLYIKMNARGKPLTVFENFKARLEHRLGTAFPNWMESKRGIQVPVKEYFSHQIESQWADLLWRYRDESTHLYDDKFMNLLRAIAIVTRSPDAPDFDLVFQELRNDQQPLTFQRCTKLGCLDEPMLKQLFSLLDKLSGSDTGIKNIISDPTYFNESEIFENTVSRKGGLTYEELLLLHAYSGYLQRHATVESDKIWNWMRVVGNLVRNTIYNRPDDFQRSLRSLNGLFEFADTILEYLGHTSDTIAGFNEQQVREEKLKAQLIPKCEDWKALILKAESHGYFAGQIEFLFKFSGLLDAWLPAMSSIYGGEQDATFRLKCSDYYEKANRVFSSQGLREFKDFLWERALLSVDNYLVESGRNLCFLKSEGRETSWKRLLRGNPKRKSDENNRLLVKQVFDMMDLSKEASVCFQDAIAQAEIGDEWRRLLVAEPRLIEYCENRLIRFQSPECIYLLRKSQMNGLHSDLFTYNLFLKHLKPQVDRQELNFKVCNHCAVKDTEGEPFIRLSMETETGLLQLRVNNTPDAQPAYAITIDWPEGVLQEEAVHHLLEEAGFLWTWATGSSPLKKTVSRDAILDELRNIGSKLRLESGGSSEQDPPTTEI